MFWKWRAVCDYFAFADHSQCTTSHKYTARCGNADRQEAVSVIMRWPVMRGEMERKEKTQVGLPTKPSSHSCQDIQNYMERISESGSPPRSCLAASLPISVIRSDILYHLFSIAHQGGCFITLFEGCCLKAAERGGTVAEVSLQHHSESHNWNFMLWCMVQLWNGLFTWNHRIRNHLYIVWYFSVLSLK